MFRRLFWWNLLLAIPVIVGQRVQIAVPIAEHLGYFLYHCHILEHEDSGMMRNFRVI